MVRTPTTVITKVKSRISNACFQEKSLHSSVTLSRDRTHLSTFEDRIFRVCLTIAFIHINRLDFILQRQRNMTTDTKTLATERKQLDTNNVSSKNLRQRL